MSSPDQDQVKWMIEIDRWRRRIEQALASGIAGGGGGGSGHVIQDEGIGLPTEVALDFIGDGVVATDDPGNNRTIVTIEGYVDYVHIQGVASATWVITHNLGRYPTPTIVDSSDNVVGGDVHYDSINQLTVTFSSVFSGKAYLT